MAFEKSNSIVSAATQYVSDMIVFLYLIPGVISSTECKKENCDPNYCNDVSCTRCLPGYYEYIGNCKKCYLGCHQCNRGQCFKCHYSDCVDRTDICDSANCETNECSSAVTCTGCPDGFYLGDHNFCYRCDNIYCKCSYASDCDECIPGKYGHSCELSCISTCDNGTCDKELGTCLTGCASDEYIDDSGECKPCLGRCLSCVNSTYCTECLQRWHWSTMCQYDCTGCISSCNRNDGCSSGCSDPNYYNNYNLGKKGYECLRCFNDCNSCLNDTYCTSCKDNFWGRKCLYSCNNCKGTCNKDEGCIDNCELGYYREPIDIGHECKPCSQQCEKCLDSSACQVCKDGYYVDGVSKICISCSINCTDNVCVSSDGTCMKGCSTGSTGSRCNGPCPTNCVECDQFNASNCKTCKNEFHGDSCEHSCSENCKLQDGIRECLKQGGTCKGGCVDNYWTKTCTEACPVGCTNQACNETNGECLIGCKIGYHGANCSLDCPDRCLDDRCFRENGTCEFECVVGSTDSRCLDGKGFD